MTNRQYYNIVRETQPGDVVYFDYQKISEGFNITPKNQMQYDGVVVNKLVIIKRTFVEKLLKRKIKKKLDLYLQYIIDVIDDDSDSEDGNGLNEILGELSRYKDIIRYKYQKYLGEEYTLLMVQKIELLEYELKLKVMKLLEKQTTYNESYEEVNVNGKSR